MHKYVIYINNHRYYLRGGESGRRDMIQKLSETANPTSTAVADRGIAELDKLAPSALAGKNYNPLCNLLPHNLTAVLFI